MVQAEKTLVYYDLDTPRFEGWCSTVTGLLCRKGGGGGVVNVHPIAFSSADFSLVNDLYWCLPLLIGRWYQEPSDSLALF